LPRKIFPEITYNVSSGKLNPTILYHTFLRLFHCSCCYCCCCCCCCCCMAC